VRQECKKRGEDKIQNANKISMIRLRRSTHQAIMREADELGLKQWAIVERMVEQYFKNRGDKSKPD
jgi:hypothetical protein